MNTYKNLKATNYSYTRVRLKKKFVLFVRLGRPEWLSPGPLISLIRLWLHDELYSKKRVINNRFCYVKSY